MPKDTFQKSFQELPSSVLKYVGIFAISPVLFRNFIWGVLFVTE
jgi:hypothetical protein